MANGPEDLSALLRRQSRSQLIATVLLFLVIAGALLGGSLAVRRNAERAGLREEAKRLASVAELKAELFLLWRRQQLADGETLRANAVFVDLVRSFLATGENRRPLASWIEAWIRGYGHRAAVLLDAEGERRLVVGEAEPEDGEDLGVIRSLVAAGETALCTRPCGMAGDPPTFELLVPVAGPEGKLPAVVVFILDPAQALFPLLRAARGEEPELEVRLIEASGAVFEVAALSGAPQLMPADPARLPEAGGAARGIVSGPGEGSGVITAVRPVEGTEWRIVVETPEAGVLARVRGGLLRIGALLSLVLGCALALAAGFWLRQRGALLTRVARIDLERGAAQRRADEALRESHERLSLALAAGQQGLYDLSLASGVATVSPEYSTMLGYPAVRTTSLATWRSRIHPDDRQRMEALIAAAARGEVRVYREECRLLNARGEWSWVITSGHVIPGNDGRPARLVGTHTDITERKRAEERLGRNVAELEAAEEKLRRTAQEWKQTFDAVADPILILDADYRVLRCNRAASELFGLPFAGILGCPCWELLRGTDHPPPGCPFTRMLRSGSREVEEIPNQERWYRVSVDPIRAVDGGLAGGVLVMSDITERRLREMELECYRQGLQRLIEERTEQLETAVKDLERFVYSVSHDLRAPLRAIEGFTEALEEHSGPVLDEEGRRLLGVVRRNSRRMDQLIADLLRLSRLGREGLRPGALDMAALASEVCADSALAAGGAAADFEVEDLPPCWADAALVRQVLANLIGNAVKFSAGRERARVQVGGRRENGLCRYHVRDWGCGFDMSCADKLFGVFQRFHGRDEYPGTGVGLAIVKSIVQRHGGQVGAESREGEGSTFWFTLPATAPERT